MRTELPTTTFVPAFGSCAVTWFAGVFELHPVHVRFQVQRLQLVDRIGLLLADERRHRHLRLPGRDPDRDRRCPSGSCCPRSDPACRRGPAPCRGWRPSSRPAVRPIALIFASAFGLAQVDVVLDRDRRVRRDLLRDLLVEEPAADARAEHERERGDPRPDRPPVDRLVEVVVDLRRRPGGGSCAGVTRAAAARSSSRAVAAIGPVIADRICVADSSVSRETATPRATRSRSASISSALW